MARRCRRSGAAAGRVRAAYGRRTISVLGASTLGVGREACRVGKECARWIQYRCMAKPRCPGAGGRAAPPTRPAAKHNTRNPSASTPPSRRAHLAHAVHHDADHGVPFSGDVPAPHGTRVAGARGGSRGWVGGRWCCCCLRGRCWGRGARKARARPLLWRPLPKSAAQRSSASRRNDRAAPFDRQQTRPFCPRTAFAAPRPRACRPLSAARRRTLMPRSRRPAAAARRRQSRRGRRRAAASPRHLGPRPGG